MRIAHLWQDYSPNLFDKAHPLCMAHGLGSEVVCQAFIDNGAAALPATFAVRHRHPAESNSRSLTDRLIRRLRRRMDERRFASLVAHRVAPELTARPNVAFRRVAKPLGSYLLGSWPLAWAWRSII